MTRSPEGSIRHRAAERGEVQNGMARSVAYRDIDLLLDLLDAERANLRVSQARLLVCRTAYDKLWAEYRLVAEPALPFGTE